MVSTIIDGGRKEEREEKAQAICEGLQIDRFERTVYGKDEEEEGGEKFGIATIRSLKHHAVFKPLHGKEKAIIILEASRLSIPAQNALLKLLEEPPEQTNIIITVEKEDHLLPTICSRCQIIHLTTAVLELSENDHELLDPIFSEGETLPFGRRLEIAEEIAKTNPADWTNKLLFMIHGQIVKEAKKGGYARLKKLAHALTATQKTHEIITTTNVNVRLTLEHLFLSL